MHHRTVCSGAFTSTLAPHLGKIRVACDVHVKQLFSQHQLLPLVAQLVHFLLQVQAQNALGRPHNH